MTSTSVSTAMSTNTTTVASVTVNYSWREPPLESTLLSSMIGYHSGEVYILNKAVQCLIILAIILAAVIANVLVIQNIFQNELKMRTVNFLLIKNLCIVDFIGAILVLPIPLIATAKGQWDFGNAMCTANSIVNVALWLEHIIMFAMLKIDRVLASCLPIGRYPLFSVETVTAIIIASWIFSFFVAGLVTALFHCSYEPAVVLCIPNLPIEFFITIFTVYCLALLAMVGGYIIVIIYLKKKQAQITNSNGVRVLDYKALERAALTSFLITISHFLLYVPTMLVIGLHGWFLHPIAILVCDMVVYAEFLIHPVVLLITSTKLRGEIKHTLKKLVHNIVTVWVPEVIETVWCFEHKGRAYSVRKTHPDESMQDNQVFEAGGTHASRRMLDIVPQQTQAADQVVLTDNDDAQTKTTKTDDDESLDLVPMISNRRRRTLPPLRPSTAPAVGRSLVSPPRRHSSTEVFQRSTDVVRRPSDDLRDAASQTEGAEADIRWQPEFHRGFVVQTRSPTRCPQTDMPCEVIFVEESAGNQEIFI